MSSCSNRKEFKLTIGVLANTSMEVIGLMITLDFVEYLNGIGRIERIKLEKKECFAK